MKQKTLLFSWFLAMLFSIVGASPAWGDDVYQKVTSVEDLVDGETYILAEVSGTTKYLATGSTLSSSKFNTVTTGFLVSQDGNTITITTASPTIITLGVETGCYTLKIGDKYLGYNSKTNFRLTQTSATANNEKWTIDGDFVIYNKQTTTRYIGQNTKIGPYADLSQYPAAHLYKKADIAVSSVSVSPTSASVGVGGTVDLTATISPDNATNKNVTWSSSNTGVATVSASGVVTGVAAGEVAITATSQADGTKSASCTVTVTDAVPVTGVSLNKSNTTLQVGSNEILTASVAPAEATNKNVTWTSSNTSVATVENGVVTAVGVGSATITVTTTDGSFTATCTITVNPTAVTGVTLNKPSVNLGVGDTEALEATIAPTNATNKTVTWTSDNTSVATVNAATGLVTGVAVGSATITATTADGSFTATCDVTVENVVTFDATKDKNTSLTKSGVHFDCTDGYMKNGSEYRLYKNSTTTISVESGKIMKIEFFGVSGNPASGFASQSGWTTDGNDGTWTGSATSVSFTASGAQVRATMVKVTVATTATPTFSVAAGEYAEAKSLEISCATDGASIYYTTNGDTPTSSSTEYTGAIDITTTTTLKAIAIKNDVESDVASATYTMNRPAAPTFDVAAGVFDAAFDLHLSTETDGATIYYTTDGTDPTSSSTAYSDGVSIPAEDTTVKAIAVKNGLTSDVATAIYTYDTRPAPTFMLSATAIDLKVNETSSAVTLTTNSDGAVTFSCENAAVTLTGTGNSRTILANAAGKYTVNVATAATSNYLAGAGTITVTVTKKATTMVLTPSFTSKDLYVTTSGSLTGVPQYNSSNIAGAEVTYSSSDETVAIIAADGAVTFNKAGSTTLTASYAGNDEYEACEESYVLNLTDSTPQEPVVEITPNYTFFGKDAQFSGSTYNELTGEKNNVSVTYTRNSGSTYANTTAMRFYKDNKLTIAAPTGYHIIGITLSLTGSSSDITADQESYNAGTGVWSGDASSVTFTRPSNASSYETISKITVTLGSVVTLSSACFGGVNYYGTYSNSNAFVVPEGLRVSAITYNTTTKKIELDNYSTGDIVAAGEGVLVSSKTYGDYTVELTNETGTSKSGNLLVGTGDSGATASDMSDTNYYYYRLTMKDDKPGFWWKTAEGAGFALAANRAYLKVSKETAASARGFNLFNDEDETTGIHSIENGKLTMENGAWYTLGGQKMNGKPATKGIYIINGKKVVVK